MLGMIAVFSLSMTGVMPAMAATRVANISQSGPSGAVTGSVSVNQSWVGDATADAFTVTLRDSDLNAASNYTQGPSGTDAFSQAFSFASGAAAGVTNTFKLANKPIADSGFGLNSSGTVVSKDGIINVDDVRITKTSGTGGSGVLVIQTVDSSNGLVTVRVTTAIDTNAATFALFYRSAAKETSATSGFPAVKVGSTTDPTGTTVFVVESGPDTGVYTGKVTTCKSGSGSGFCSASTAGTSSASAQVRVLSGDTITVKYTDAVPTGAGAAQTVSTTLRVDATAPTVSNTTPANGTLTKDTAPRFAADVTDSDSGVNKDQLTLSVDGSTVSATKTTSTIAGGFRVELVPSSALSAAAHTWQIVAKDNAGNTGKSDKDLSTSALDAHAITVKTSAPIANFAKTGEFWDTTQSPPANSVNKATSIRVNFDVALDPTTVAASDFTVGGAIPTDAFTPVTSDATGKVSVYLTIPKLSANERPIVKITGQVADKAGNTKGVTTISDVRDGIKPTVAATLSKTKVSSKNLAESSTLLDITVDEALKAAPTVKVTATLPVAATNSDVVNLGSASFVTTGKYQLKVKASALIQNKKNYIIISAEDLAGNVRTQSNLSSNLLIAVTSDEVVGTATTLFNPAWTSGQDPTVIRQTTVFVKATFTEKVSITSATFNGVSVLGEVLGEGDGKVWQYVAKDLAVGSINTFSIKALDAIGNASGAKTTRFRVLAPLATKINLYSGWNLFSVHDNLTDGSIDSVFSGLDIDLVMTYDQDSGWVTATKDPATGKYVGNLTTIQTGKGYFAHANSPALLSILTATRAPTDLPPSIGVSSGWNLIGYTSLPKVNDLKVSQYLFGVKWVSLYSFNPDPAVAYQYAKPSAGGAGSHTAATGSASFDLTGSDPIMKIGKGYWLNVSADGNITP
jgi:hypothetical protein